MASAAFVDAIPVDRHRSALATGIVLSLVLHVGAAVLLTYRSTAHETPPPQIVMEMVQLPKPPAPKPPEPPAVAPPTPTVPPPPPPQLTEAPIAEKSVAPPIPAKSSAPTHERPLMPHPQEKKVASAAPALPANSGDPIATPVSRERSGRPASGETDGKLETASQSVQDFILMQIAQAWVIDLHSPHFANMAVGWGFVLRPDGMLEPPFGKNDPWDLSEMVRQDTYAVMQQPTEQGRLITTLVTTFLQAVRQAQPFRVPRNEQSYQNRILPLNFRLGDLPQGPAQAGH